MPPTPANQHQQTQKDKFDAELKSSDSCWCQLLPGSCSLHILPAPTKQPTHQQVWFGTQSSFQREPEHLRHLHEGARLMGQGCEAVLKALGEFASVEVEPEDLQNSSSSASGRQVGGGIGAARAAYAAQRGDQSAATEGLRQTWARWG